MQLCLCILEQIILRSIPLGWQIKKFPISWQYTLAGSAAVKPDVSKACVPQNLIIEILRGLLEWCVEIGKGLDFRTWGKII